MEWVALFHGHLRPDRNVHGLIASVPLWPEHIRLEVRGNGSAAYVQSLTEQVRSLGLGDRVVISPAVAYLEVVPSAARADLGIIPWPLDQPQKRISLPNKLFEYLMAGLAVLATAPSEASRLVESYGFGVGYAPASPAALAAALRGLSQERLLTLRDGAARARTELCWEREKEVLWRVWEKASGLAG
jgi:glycogen(starch) synthase